MLPALRSLASAKLAWHLHAKTVAPDACPTTHTRVGKDRAGNPRTWQVVRRPKKIVSNGAKGTGDVLLTMAYRATQRVVGVPALWSSLVLTDTGTAELPPVTTNSVELAEKRGLTDRTIRTHLAELKRCGFISRYKYRGTNASYCVWINPNFVWEAAPAAPKSAKMSPPEGVFLGPEDINLPLIEILEPLESPKYEISNVEKLVTAREPNGPGQNWNPPTGIAGPQANLEAGAQVPKSGAGGAGAARRARFYQTTADRGTGAKKAEAKRLVEWFWSFSKNLIYKGKAFNEEAERQAKNAIWNGVFAGFTQGEPADWLQWLPGLQRRVELAAAWFARNPKNWPSTPYAERIAGRGYFDAGNAQGFTRTEAWWRTELASRQQGALERALDEAMTELAQRRRLDAGERRVQASKRAKQKTFLELHRYHHTKLRRLGGEDALVRFAARLEADRILTLSI